MTDPNPPSCTKHNIAMERKDGYRGPFWGCPTYHDTNCRVTFDISPDGSIAPPDNNDTTTPGASDSADGIVLGNKNAPLVSVLWNDNTLDRPGWLCRYTTIGGRLRSSETIAKASLELSQAWFASTDPKSIPTETVRRVTSSMKKVLQRGDTPPIHPESEFFLIDSIGESKNLNRSPLPGDLSGVLDKDIFLHLADEIVEVPASIKNERDQNIRLDSSYEEQFVETWVPENLGQSASRWFVPQASFDAMTSQIGSATPTGRRVDFLVHKPFTKPFIVEIDGEQHDEATSSDKNRDFLLNSTGIEVIRIPTSELRDKKGPNLDKVKEYWVPSTIDLEDPKTKKALFAPVLLHRFITAMLDGIDSGFLEGSRWHIQLDSDIDFDLEMTAPYFRMLLAYDLLWQGSVVPEEILLTNQKDSNRYRYVKTDNLFEQIDHKTDEASEPDLIIRLQPCNTSVEDLPPPAGDTPEIVVRSARLPVSVKDDFLEPPERATLPDLTPDELKWALTEILQGVFAKKKFREGQVEAISEILRGSDCAVLLPTGSGKSLIYQMIGMCTPGRTIVIDPLIALIEDQILGLQGHGIDRAVGISAYGLSQGYGDTLKRQIESGDAIFIFVAPERFQKNDFRQSIKSVSQVSPINFVVVDEAHCVSEWGHQFRTAYLTLGNVLREVCQDITGSKPPVLALTGTASRAVLNDVINQLGLDVDGENSIIRPQSFDRKELKMEVKYSPPADSASTLSGTIQNMPSKFGMQRQQFFRTRGHQTQSGLIFCPHVNSTRDERGILDVRRAFTAVTQVTPGIYSGGAPKALKTKSTAWEKEKRLYADEFKANNTPALVCTNAFGMGIDKPNIRYVIHYGLPGSIESYYQEIGRAGRDGNDSICTLLWDEQDRNRSDRLTLSDTSLEDVRKEFGDIGKVDQDDITRQLYFLLGTFPGVKEELNELKKLTSHEEIAPKIGVRATVDLPYTRKDEGEKEKAIYRLMLLGIVSDYRKEATFQIDLRAISPSEIVAHLHSFIERTEPGARQDSVDQLISSANTAPLGQIIEAAAAELINFIYDVVVESRRRSFREMYVATRDSGGDGEILRARVLDYLTMGDVSPRLESLMEAKTFSYDSWESELQAYVSLDDARELRGNSARLLSSSPFHPGLLYARAYAELIHPDGDLQDLGANFRTSLTSARDRYAVTEEELDKFVARTLTLIQNRSHRGLAVVLDIVLDMGIGYSATDAILKNEVTKSGGDPGVKVIALAHSLASIADQLEQAIRSNSDD